MQNNYFRAKPKSNNDPLNFFIGNLKHNEDLQNYVVNHYELVRGCTDCTRIIAALTYVEDENILGVLWIEFTESKYTKDGIKAIRAEEKKIRNSLKQAGINLEAVHFSFSNLDRRLNGCRLIENCRPDQSRGNISA